MLKFEFLEDNKLIRHFSDNNKYIKQVETGLEYCEAIDILPCKYTYEETENEILIESEELL